MISMKKVNYAAIDIGSNAVRLLIKCVNEENAPELMSKVQLIRIPLRLGEDAFTMGVISAEKEKKLIRLMKAYKQLMKIYDVVDYRACATSAMRDARNGKDIARQIARKTAHYYGSDCLYVCSAGFGRFGSAGALGREAPSQVASSHYLRGALRLLLFRDAGGNGLRGLRRLSGGGRSGRLGQGSS